jgi:hypothetical protein
MSYEVPDWLHPRVVELLNVELNEALYRENLAVILKIPPVQDGNQWCVLYGKDLHDGIAGFGDTPWAAMRAFHDAMLVERAPTPNGGSK